MLALIVDDEPLAHRGVVLRLRKFKDIEIVGQCGDGVSAVEKILDLSPDLVFLDVQMPGMDGFEVLRAVPKEKLPNVIFLTAYEQHAVRAFEVHALDYLLKPVDDERFAAAIGRARKLVDSSLKTRMAERVLQMLDQTQEKFISRFTVQTGPRIQIVQADDVDWIGAAGDYAELHAHGRAYLLRETMASLARGDSNARPLPCQGSVPARIGFQTPKTFRARLTPPDGMQSGAKQKSPPRRVPGGAEGREADATWCGTCVRLPPA